MGQAEPGGAGQAGHTFTVGWCRPQTQVLLSAISWICASPSSRPKSVAFGAEQRGAFAGLRQGSSTPAVPRVGPLGPLAGVGTKSRPHIRDSGRAFPTTGPAPGTA